jgi:Mn2+/Fe2+ NRAMP family transporter
VERGALSNGRGAEKRESVVKRKFLSIIGPGILVAATGIGAGDLATAAFAGSKLGLAILWAVLVGAFFKFVLNEGLTRWQLATGTTLLEGTVSHLGRPAQYFFLLYLLIWSFLVAAALMSACGVAAQAIFPLFQDPSTGKIVYGMIFSIVGLVLVRLGGYRLFEIVMNASIGLMFITVVLTAILLEPNWGQLITGIILPTIPKIDGEGLAWTVALMGGVGGTVTILCYGYWIREEGRFGDNDLRDSRFDLAIAYAMTAVFGLAMVVIGSTVEIEGGGASLIIDLADRLVDKLGLPGKWIFLLGAFGAIFSSLLGVWQSIPYLFADLWGQLSSGQTSKPQKVSTNSKPYRFYLYGMASIPMIGLWIGFLSMQKFYAIFGALFIPILAVVLLILNGRAKFIGKEHMNHPSTSAILIIILLFFLMVVWLTIRSLFGL